MTKWEFFFFRRKFSKKKKKIYTYINIIFSEESDAPREASEETSEIKHLSFVVTAIKTPGMYRLVYFTQNSGIFGILGMSQAFAGHHR